MDIRKIIEKKDPDKVLAALVEARRLAKDGSIIHLLDFLCPEDAIVGVYGKRNKQRYGEKQ